MYMKDECNGVCGGMIDNVLARPRVSWTVVEKLLGFFYQLDEFFESFEERGFPIDAFSMLSASGDR